MSLSGCKTVIAILNSQKVSSADEQLRSLKENNYNLTKMKSADIAINIGAYDFDSLVVPAIRHDLSQKKKLPHVNDYSVDKFSLKTDKQQINISTDFQASFDTLNASISGKLIGTISNSIRNDTLRLFPAFKYVHINRLTYKRAGKIGDKVIAAILNLALKLFLEKINGYIVSNLPVIPLNLVDNEVTRQDLVKGQLLNITLSKPLKISTPIFYSATLINPNGFHVLASLTKLPTESAIAMDSSGIKFNDSFTAFEAAFKKKSDLAFPGLPMDKTTSSAISRVTFSAILNGALNDETISVTYGPDDLLRDKQVDKHIEFTCDDIKCGDIHLDCPGLRIVRDCGTPDFGHCDNCDHWYDFDCQKNRALCLAAVDARRVAWYSTGLPACLALKATQEAFNVGVRAACKTTELAAQGTCATIKATDLGCITGDHHFSIGDIHLKYGINLTARASISGIKFDSNLSSLDLALSASSVIGVNSTFEFHPMGPVGHLACALKFKDPYNCSVSADVPPNNMHATGVFDNSASNRLYFNFKTSPVKNIGLVMNPTPLQLISKDIPTLLDCPLLGALSALGNLTKTFHDIFTKADFDDKYASIFFDGKYNFDFPAMSLGVPIKSAHLKLMEKEILLTPVAKDSYIGFFNSTKSHRMSADM